jgi:hypothetical protein
VTPYSFGHLQLMQHDNIPGINRLPELLRAQAPPQAAACTSRSTVTGISQER